MTFNKSKAIANAQKLVGQGKLKDAIREYKKIYSQDPKDPHVLNTLGDLHVREQRVKEALGYYTELADIYASEGFLVRGIAMYKKISKLDPGNIHALERLADLYTMQGMLPDARSHYLRLAEAHLKADRAAQAMAIMQKVFDLDPDNFKIQQRLAGLYERHGQAQQAAAIYRRLGERLLSEGQIEESQQWVRKAVAQAPKNTDVLLLQARLQQQAGEAAAARATLEKICRMEEKPEALELLLPARLETGDVRAAEELAGKLLHSDPAKFGGFLQLALHAAKEKDSQRTFTLLERVLEPALQYDPMQLVEVMREVATHLPLSPQLLDRLAHAAREAKNQTVLVEALSQRAQAAAQQEDFATAKRLYVELVSLEPQNQDFFLELKRMREALGEAEIAVEAAAAETAEAGPAAVEVKLDPQTEAFVNSTINDIDLFSTYGLTDKALELVQQLLDRVPDHIVGNEKLLDLYLGSANAQGVVEVATHLGQLYNRANNPLRAEELSDLARRYAEKARETVAAEPAPEAPAEAPIEPGGEIPAELVAEAPAEGEAGIHEVDLSTEWALAEATEEAVAAEPPAKTGEAAAPAFNTEEVREEINLLLAQGLVDEARQALAGYREQFPGEPALEELQERIEAAVAAAQAAPAEAAGPEAEAAPAAAGPAEEVPVGDAAREAEVAAEEGQIYEIVLEEEPPAAEPAPAPMSAQEFLSELAGEFDQVFEAAPPVSAPEEVAAPPAAAVPSEPLPPPPGQEAEEPPAGLLAELFQEFKEEMEQTEEVEDIESHYNLGIAYKEMGLLDEAVSEFQKVAKAAEKQRAYLQLFQSCTLLGFCFVDKGMPQIAVRWYERALRAPGVDEEGAVALRYDMGVAQELAGNRKAALDCFMEVYAVNVDYRDVSERIRELKGA